MFCRARCWITVCLVGAALTCGQFARSEQGAANAKPASAGETTARRAPIVKLESEHLPNPIQITKQVISGGLPEDEAAFAELKALGIKTVVTVDGAKPDVALAKKFGMRYVHLPHGYDGIPENRAEELAKAIRDLPGPIYVHCHHGMHRSPAAAAVACIGAGLIPPEAGATILKIAGTSENYRGLFESVERTQPLDKALLDKMESDFPSIAKLPAMAEAMVEVEHAHDHLKALAKASWRRIPELPALVPVHEALLLREHFTELLRTKEVGERPAGFQTLMRQGESAAQDLQTALERELKAPDEADQKALGAALKKVSDNCTQCHKAYRDVPLGRKPK